MRKLDIKIVGHNSMEGLVMKIDGKVVKLKKNAFDNYVYHLQTEEKRVRVQLYRVIDVGGPIWFIVQLFFYLITLFGLFDIRIKESCLFIDAEYEVELKDLENNVMFMINNDPKQNDMSIEIDSDHIVTTIASDIYLDENAKKRRKTLKICKIILGLLLIAVAITAIVLITIN